MTRWTFLFYIIRYNIIDCFLVRFDCFWHHLCMETSRQGDIQDNFDVHFANALMWLFFFFTGLVANTSNSHFADTVNILAYQQKEKKKFL